MTDKYCIKNPSQKFLADVISNPPENFVVFHGRFLADGVRVPYLDENNYTYLKICNEKNIVPFSRKEIKYNSRVEEIITEHPEGAKKFFGGGRTNEISIDIGYEKELVKLREIYIPSLLENNYQINWGKLVFGLHSAGSHETKGLDSHLSININYRGDDGVQLEIDEYYAEKEKMEKFKNWFSEIRKKHSL